MLLTNYPSRYFHDGGIETLRRFVQVTVRSDFKRGFQRSHFSRHRTKIQHAGTNLCKIYLHRALENEGEVDADGINCLPFNQEELDTLIQSGREMKDVIKLGRRGVCPDVVEHIKKRWNTSKVRWLVCCPVSLSVLCCCSFVHLPRCTDGFMFVVIPS